jgi:hypothetical protein
MLKQYSFILFLLTGLVCNNINDNKNSNGNKTYYMNKKTIEIHFHNADENHSFSDEANPFSVLVRMSDRFPVFAGTFNLDFILKYDGVKQVAIYNPLYFLQYMVQFNDVYLKTDRKAPIPLINSKSGINADDFNFDILKIEENGNEINIKNEVRKFSIEVNKGDSISYSLRIPGYVQAGNLVTFRPGVYQLTFLFSAVIVHDENEPSKSMSFTTNPVTLCIE